MTKSMKEIRDKKEKGRMAERKKERKKERQKQRRIYF